MPENKWSSKMGFYLISIGSAFGLGSLWRFPYIANDNGGGGFLWLYLGMVVVIGMPLLVGEILLGKVTRAGLIEALSDLKIQNKKETNNRFLVQFPGIGVFTIVLCLCLLSYYSVVCGWVLHYIMQFFVSLFSAEPFSSENALVALQENGLLQWGLTSTHILMVTLVVAKGVEEGVEKWVSQLMPLFILLLFGVTWISLSLPNSNEALRFFFYPNFSTLKLTSLSDAIGHSLFTLSVGFGTMVTFGSYLKKKVYVPGAGFKVSTLDSLTAIFAGIIIFPLVLSSAVPAEGPLLLFQTVPKLFAQMQGGKFWGVVFFLCLYLAALGASTGILETIVSNMQSRSKIKRDKSTWLAGGVCFLISLIPAFSSSVFKDVKLLDKPLFEFIDLFLVNWLVPITALVVSQIVIYKLPTAKKIEEFKQEDFPRYATLYKHWYFVMKYVVPTLIIFSFILQIISFFSYGI